MLHWQAYQINCEESMKKIPILLSTLTLTTSAVLVMGTMTALANDITEEGTIQLNSETFEVPQISEDVIHSESNIYDNRVEIYVNPLKNEMTFLFDELSDDWVRKMIVVQHNYEDGILEEEADERMKTLGVDDYSDWATKLDDWDNNLTGRYPFRPNSMDLLLDRYLSNVLGKEHPNFFYYAVQFWHHSTGENGEDIWDDSYWIRGKIDLRSCVRSSVLSSSALKCVADTKNNGQPYKFVLSRNNTLVEMPVENIITWDEEWQGILLRRHKQLTDNVKNLHKDVLTGANLTESYGIEIEKLRVLISKYDQNGDQLYELRQAENQLKEVKAFYEKMTESGSEVDEIKLLQSQNAELKTKNETLETNLVKADQEKQALMAELDENKQELETLRSRNAALKQEIDVLRQQLSKDDESELDSLMRENEHLKQQNKTLEDKIGQNEVFYKEEIRKLQSDLDEKMKLWQLENEKLKETCTSTNGSQEIMGQVSDEQAKSQLVDQEQIMRQEIENVQSGVQESNEAVPEDMITNSDSEAIEVPSLGVVETKSWLWWLILPLMAILMLGVGIKRILLRKH